MSLTAALFIFTPRALASAYTSEYDVVALASLLIPIAGFFQVFDGLQIVSAGALRGAGDTRAPLVVNIVGFWCLGLPTSWLLGFKLGYGPQGLWWGVVVGLGAVALFLMIRLVWMFRGDLRRVQVD
jgi:MATE family multidrug resistance protein